MIAGGTGFVGSALTDALIARGDKPTLLTRDPEAPQQVAHAVDLAVQLLVTQRIIEREVGGAAPTSGFYVSIDYLARVTALGNAHLSPTPRRRGYCDRRR